MVVGEGPVFGDADRRQASEGTPHERTSQQTRKDQHQDGDRQDRWTDPPGAHRPQQERDGRKTKRCVEIRGCGRRRLNRPVVCLDRRTCGGDGRGRRARRQDVEGPDPVHPFLPVTSLGHVVDEGAKRPLGRAERRTIEIRAPCGYGDARDRTAIPPLSRNDTFSQIAHQPVDRKSGGTRGCDLER